MTKWLDFFQGRIIYDNYFNYVKIINNITYIDIDNIIKKGKIDYLICPIRFFILKDPVSCSKRKNSHTFCRECIDKYLQENNNCPTCKLNFGYKKRKKIINGLNKFTFNCVHKMKVAMKFYLIRNIYLILKIANFILIYMNVKKRNIIMKKKNLKNVVIRMIE